MTSSNSLLTTEHADDGTVSIDGAQPESDRTSSEKEGGDPAVDEDVAPGSDRGSSEKESEDPTADDPVDELSADLPDSPATPSSRLHPRHLQQRCVQPRWLLRRLLSASPSELPLPARQQQPAGSLLAHDLQ